MKQLVSLRAYHREIHRASLEQARRLARHDRAAAFRLLAQAKAARFYFGCLYGLDE